MELNSEFYDRMLAQIKELSDNDSLAVCEFQEIETKKTVHAVSRVQINPVTRMIEFIPITFFWNKNPMQSMRLTDRPILSIQKPYSQWEKLAKKVTVNLNMLN